MASYDTIPPDHGFTSYSNIPHTMRLDSEDCSTSSSMSIVAVNSVTGTYSNIEYKYDIDNNRVIGTGYYSSVKECTDRTTGQRYAVKSILKSNPAVKKTELHREVRLLQEMKHDNIIQLVDVFEDAEYLHLVTDLCIGGELYDRIVKKKQSVAVGCFAEDEAAQILYQVLKAVSYLHSQDVVHRDVKPENIVFETNEKDSCIKLVDFGLARNHYQSSFEPYMTDVVGTPYFLAPEVLREKYDKSCDLWSVGVTAFVLLGGYPPFRGRNSRATMELIKRGKFTFHSNHWKYVSKEGRDFISRLLKVNPKKRMSADEALNHPWIVKHATTEKTKEELADKTTSSQSRTKQRTARRSMFRW